MHKLIEIFSLPPTLIAIGMATCLFLFFRGKYRSGKIFLVVVFLIYYLFSIKPFASLLVRSLEVNNVVKMSSLNIEEIETIVVLSGGVSKKGGHRPYHELSGMSWRRLWHGVEVFKELKGRTPILYVGGIGKTFKSASIEAELAKKCAIAAGLPDEKFWTESTARNTHESGIAIKRILDERYPSIKKHKIILVTSVLHMRRSKKVMEKIGIQTIPSSADFVARSLKPKPLSFIPSVRSFYVSNFAIREWIGIGCYKLLGRI